MNNLNFEECEISGQMFARGIKGQYWINQQVWSHLMIVRVGKDGPYLEKISTYDTLEDAVAAANVFDNSEIDND